MSERKAPRDEDEVERMILTFESLLRMDELARCILAEHRPERRRARRELHEFVDAHGRALLAACTRPACSPAALDALITRWRRIASAPAVMPEDRAMTEHAPHYVAALQSARQALFGELMGEEETIATG